MAVRQAAMRDLPEVARMAQLLWPGQPLEERLADLADIMAKEDAAFFLCEAEGETIGFAQCQLRHDYVEGTETSPVGYLEGIFVVEEHRGRGHARALLAACERWAKKQGCTEFASDCELHNEASLRFHLKMGFAEANRIICFTRALTDA